MQILVFVDFLSPRVKYIVGHVLEKMLGLNVTYTLNIDEINSFNGPKICYSKAKANDSIQITPHDLLSLNGIFKQSFAFFKWRSLPAFFQTNPGSIIPFDIFSASFYLITRYEEYLTKNTDIHGRFMVEESLAFQNGFLQIPLVDLWVKEFGSVLKDKYPDIKIREQSFTFIPTIDIDNAFAYLHKGFVRSSLSLAKSLINFRLREVSRRLSVLLSRKNDPYCTYDKLFKILERSPQASWFILGGSYGKYDKNIPVDHVVIKKILQRIGKDFNVGIHPSYNSDSDLAKISVEKNALEKVLDRKIKFSRQHYLRFYLPETYKVLSDLGISHDFSMGYSNAIGFRASTCTPFGFYNLIDENELPLIVVPFQVMDRALLHESKANQIFAVQLAQEMAIRVKAVGGTFVTVWHNESLSGLDEWKGWEDVLERIVSDI